MYCPVLAAHHNKTTMKWFPVRPFIFWPPRPQWSWRVCQRFVDLLLSFYWQLRRRSLAFSAGAENRCRNICLQTTVWSSGFWSTKIVIMHVVFCIGKAGPSCAFSDTAISQSLFIWKVMESIHPWPGCGLSIPEWSVLWGCAMRMAVAHSCQG